MKRSPLGPGREALARGSSFSAAPKPLARNVPKRKPRSISPASPAQRDAIKGRVCVVCQSEHVQPAHLIDRSLGGDDDALAIVPLCPPHHREYDDGFLSLLEYLEPHYRDEVAHAVKTVGLVMALNRITNDRYVPSPRTHGPSPVIGGVD